MNIRYCAVMIAVLASVNLSRAWGDRRAGGEDAGATPSNRAAALRPVRAATGGFELAWAPGDRSISIRRTETTRTNEALRWMPGGRATDLPVLDTKHLRSAECQTNAYNQSFLMKGELDWCDYTIGVELLNHSPGFIHLWLDVTPSQARGPEQRLFADGGPEFVYASDAGQALDPDAVFYFETPVPHPVKLWDWRSDLNQFVYFGDRKVLDATVLACTDFTDMNDYFSASGTRIFKRWRGWESHEDIVERPAGALGTAGKLPFAFGLKLPEAKLPLAVGKSYRVSSTFLRLQAGAPPIQPATEPAMRFLDAYRLLFEHVRKPEPQFHDWPDLTDKLVSELSRRRDPDWGYWTLSGPHFNLLPYLDYFERFSPQQNERLKPMALKQLLQAYAPDYTNDFGRRGIYGWYPTREKAAKSDFWQGYLWPLFIANEFALTRKNDEVRRMALNLPGVLLDTGRRTDYTFAVFVDINAASNVVSEYDYDYGAAGLYAALMLQYHQLTGDKMYLDEAQKAARKLIRFGFCGGFEMNVTALSALTLLRLHQLTGDPHYLEGSYVQLAVIFKHTWLFNPQYERFKDRDLFALTSCRANINYANSAEEGMIMRFLRQYLLEGEKSADPRWQGLVAQVLRYKAHAWADALPARHTDKSLLHLAKPENWDPVQPDSHVPMEPFGYNFDDKKLGFLNECVYGCNLLSEAALMQFHPLGGDGMLYTEGPVAMEKAGEDGWTVRTLGQNRSMKAGVQGSGAWQITNADLAAPTAAVRSGAWTWFTLSTQTTYSVRLGK